MNVVQIIWCVRHSSAATRYQAEQDFPLCDWRRFDELSHDMTTRYPCKWEFRLLIDTEGIKVTKGKVEVV